MFFIKKEKKDDFIRCRALVCSSNLTNCEKIKEQLYMSDKKGFNIFFYRIDVTRFALEAKKMLRKNQYDFLIMDATMDKSPTIQIIANAKNDNPNLKAMVLTPTLNFEIKQWKEVGSIDGFQLIPYQLIPFLKNVSDVINGVKEKIEPIQETPLNLDLDIDEEEISDNKNKVEEENKEVVDTKENNDIASNIQKSLPIDNDEDEDDSDLGIVL